MSTHESLQIFKKGGFKWKNTDPRYRNPAEIFQDFLKNAERTVLCLYGMKLLELPQDFWEQIGHKVTAVYLEGNQLTSLPTQGLSQCAKLAFVDFSDNKLTGIPQAFAEIPKLTELRAARNQIKELPKGFFDGRQALEVVDVSDNQLGKFLVHGRPSPKLRYLDISENQLTAIPNNPWVVFEDLRTFFCHKNPGLAAPPTKAQGLAAAENLQTVFFTTLVVPCALELFAWSIRNIAWNAA